MLTQSNDSEFQEYEQEEESISLDSLLDEENRPPWDVLMGQITDLIENSEADPKWEVHSIDQDLEPFLGWDEILPSIRMNVRQQLDTEFHGETLNLDSLLLFNPSSSQKHVYMRAFQSQYPLDRAFHSELFQELSDLIPIISPALCEEQQPNRSMDIENHKEDFENIGSFLTLKEQSITQIRVNHHIPYYSDAGFGLFQLNHPRGSPTLYLIRFVTHEIFRDALPSLIVWVLCEFNNLQMYSYLIPQTIRKEKCLLWHTFWQQWWGDMSYEIHDLAQRMLMIQKRGIQLDFLIENSITTPTISKYLRSPEYWEDITKVYRYDSIEKQYFKQDEQELIHYKTYQQQLANDGSSDIVQEWINPQEMNNSKSSLVSGEKI